MIKYPRTYHFPWSPGLQNDDRMLESLEGFEDEEIVITEKMDGENTTLYREGIHARALSYSPREDRDWMMSIYGRIKHDIPEGWRLCGEQLYGIHSISYKSLPSYFMLFSIWDENNRCLSWDDTIEWAKLLDLELVPTLYRGKWNMNFVKNYDLNRLSVQICDRCNCGDSDCDLDGIAEGYVVRVARSFHFNEFNKVVGKYVRKDHITTDEHWTHKKISKNGLK